MTSPTYLSGILQVRAYRILQQHVGEVLKAYDLKPTHWFILGHVADNNGATAAEIAELIKVEPPLVTNLVNELVGFKLIKRSSHPTDGRVKLLQVTTRAERLIPQIESALSADLGRLLTGVNATDIKHYQKVLQAIVSND